MKQDMTAQTAGKYRDETSEAFRSGSEEKPNRSMCHCEAETHDLMGFFLSRAAGAQEYLNG